MWARGEIVGGRTGGEAWWATMARHGKGGMWASRGFGFMIMYRVPELAQGLGQRALGEAHVTEGGGQRTAAECCLYQLATPGGRSPAV